MRLPLSLLIVFSCAGILHADTPSAQEILDATGITGGAIVHLGCGDGKLTAQFGENGKCLVHGLDVDQEKVVAARKHIQAAGLYGRVSVDAFDGQHLPYADNLINLVVVDNPGKVSRDEILRVLAPLGVAYFREAKGWTKTVKPWPDDIDEWSHHLHAADGNPVARDTRVGPPKHYQWIADPVWAQSHESDSNLRCLVTARGRIYYIVNEAPTSLAGPESPPDEWFLAARDAFNGIELWKMPVKPWGWREWKPSWFTPRPGVIPINLDKRLVAAGDDLFVTLGYGSPVSRIDGRTGKVLKTYDDTKGASEILYRDGHLVLTIVENDRAAVKLLDVDSGRLLWTSAKDYGGTVTDYYRFTAMRGSVPAAKVAPTLDIATDGKVVGLLDGDSVVCLDYATGEERWRSTFPLVEADYDAGRIKAQDKVWTGTMIVADGVVIHASPNQLAAFAADSGKLLWKQPKKFLQHLWYEWKDVFVIDGLVWTWSAGLARAKLQGKGGNSSWPMTINGYDLKTGELKREIPLGNIFKTYHHHRCYRNKATVRYVLASRRGTEFVDLSGGEHSVNNWVRGTCHMGMMPANGLQYAPPHPCQCYIDEKLNAFNALAATRDTTPPQPATPIERARAAKPTAGKAKASDWPAFRADKERSCSVDTTIPADAKLLWHVKPGNSVGAPICVGNTAFVPLKDEHQIVALNAKDGTELWRFTTGGRIDSPPTYDRGGLLFGSADGWVYRIEAADGSLVWRLRAAPEDRRMAAFGQLESLWPVSGSVLVDQGTAYFAAGRSSHLDGGLTLFAVDAAGGEILHKTTLTGPSYTDKNIEQNYLLPMGVLPDVLRIEDSALFMRAVKFDRQLRRQPGDPKLQIRGGLLDDAYFKRMNWSLAGSHARLFVFDGSQAYGLRMFDSLQGLDPKVYFTPGKKGYLLFANEAKNGKNVWQKRIPIRGRAMVVAGDQLCVAGPPDVVDKEDPLGAFENRKGGVLLIVDKTDGRTISEHKLTMPPVFNGAAAANGRLILTLEDGSVVCFGAALE